MTIPIVIEDGGGSGLTVTVGKHNGESGLVVFTEDLRTYEPRFLPAFNSDFGIDMAQDFAFGGIPIEVHDGIDNGYWTASAISGGSKFTFDHSNRANSGVQSIRVNNANVGHTMQVAKGSNQDLSGYSSITMFVNIDRNWAASSADSFEISGWDTGTSLMIGSSVLLETYMSETVFDTWHRIVIPFSDMGLVGATIDAFRITCLAKSGTGPRFFIDDWQIEQTGSAQIYSVLAPRNTLYYIESISFSIVDNISGAVADGTMPGIPYNTFLGLAALSTGIVFRRIKNNEVVFTSNIRSIEDLLHGGSTLINQVSDGTNTSITLLTEFPAPVILDSRNEDRFEFLISEDLSPLVSFKVLFRGKTRVIGD